MKEVALNIEPNAEPGPLVDAARMVEVACENELPAVWRTGAGWGSISTAIV